MSNAGNFKVGDEVVIDGPFGVQVATVVAVDLARDEVTVRGVEVIDIENGDGPDFEEVLPAESVWFEE